MPLRASLFLSVLLLPICLAAQEARSAAPATVQETAQPPAVQTPAPPATPQPPSTDQPDPAVAPKPDTPTEQPGIQAGTRILGVLPNYKTVEKMTGAYEPLTPGAKFMIATKDSISMPP